MHWDEEQQTCVITLHGDLDFDLCVGLVICLSSWRSLDNALRNEKARNTAALQVLLGMGRMLVAVIRMLATTLTLFTTLAYAGSSAT